MSHSAGYASSSSAPLHFGLGPAKVVDEIEIKWPSGIRQVLKKVAADQVVKVTEINAPESKAIESKVSEKAK